MSGRLIDGKALGALIRTEVAEEVQALGRHGLIPGLAVVLVGDDPASHVYVRSKGKACEEAGMHSVTHILPEATPEAELLAIIDRLNADPSVHGLLVQLPLPKHINTERVLLRVEPRKDVDGFHPVNVGKVLLGDPTGFRPATPYGVQQMLIRSGIETRGAHAVIVGRSTIVGRPMASLLIQDAPGGNATVTTCHSRTHNLRAMTRQADILVVAIGRPELVTADMVKPGAAVIDVGITRLTDDTRPRGYRLVGDVAFDAVRDVAGWITPVPGGVGPMTIAMLLRNTLQAATLEAGVHGAWTGR
ncbi:MAG: bifunctional methylenetetrahydrofolate dehydrogenase/methenyltetrahydrofolate cyclohydrolase FolD [Gemmatimonadales bacterium]